MISEPQHINEILPAVIANIETRMERHRKKQHRRRVVSAVQDFMGSSRSSI